MVGFPKSSILIGFSIRNHPFWGTTPVFGTTHIRTSFTSSCIVFLSYKEISINMEYINPPCWIWDVSAGLLRPWFTDASNLTARFFSIKDQHLYVRLTKKSFVEINPGSNKKRSHHPWHVFCFPSHITSGPPKQSTQLSRSTHTYPPNRQGWVNTTKIPAAVRLKITRWLASSAPIAPKRPAPTQHWPPKVSCSTKTSHTGCETTGV